MKNYLVLALISVATAVSLFELAAHDIDYRQQVRIIDVPYLTSADATRLGLVSFRPAPHTLAVQVTVTPRKALVQRPPDKGGWRSVEISTYSRSYHGNGTHSGERYDHYRGHTAATTIIGRRWVLPKGSVWEVEYLGQTITVRINDTGSWRPKKASVWLDLSGAAWRDLTGIAPSRKVARMRRVK